MTVIAFRDGVLAADSLITDPPGNKNGTARKIGREGNARWATCGDTGGAQQILDWLLAGAKGRQPRPSSGTVIWIPDEGRPRIYTSGQSWLVADAPFYAWGSGQDIARGAMYMGASPIEACEAACELEVWCGPPIVTQD